MNGKKKFLEVEFTLSQPGDSFQQVSLTKLIAHFKVTLTVELIDAAQPELANTISNRASIIRRNDSVEENCEIHEVHDESAQMETPCDIESVEELLAEGFCRKFCVVKIYFKI